jgi:hypothetical protein
MRFICGSPPGCPPASPAPLPVQPPPAALPLPSPLPAPIELPNGTWTQWYGTTQGPGTYGGLCSCASYITVSMLAPTPHLPRCLHALWPAAAAPGTLTPAPGPHRRPGTCGWMPLTWGRGGSRGPSPACQPSAPARTSWRWRWVGGWVRGVHVCGFVVLGGKNRSRGALLACFLLWLVGACARPWRVPTVAACAVPAVRAAGAAGCGRTPGQHLQPGRLQHHPWAVRDVHRKVSAAGQLPACPPLCCLLRHTGTSTLCNTPPPPPPSRSILDMGGTAPNAFNAVCPGGLPVSGFAVRNARLPPLLAHLQAVLLLAAVYCVDGLGASCAALPISNALRRDAPAAPPPPPPPHAAHRWTRRQWVDLST